MRSTGVLTSDIEGVGRFGGVSDEKISHVANEEDILYRK